MTPNRDLIVTQTSNTFAKDRAEYVLQLPYIYKNKFSADNTRVKLQCLSWNLPFRLCSFRRVCVAGKKKKKIGLCIRVLSCKQYQICIYKFMLGNYENRNPAPLFNFLMYWSKSLGQRRFVKDLRICTGPGYEKCDLFLVLISLWKSVQNWRS